MATSNVAVQPKPKVYIARRAYQKIMHWVNKANAEVGGLGIVNYEKNGNYFWVSDAYLLKQVVSGTTTELDAQAVGELEFKVHKEKQAGTLKGELNFWWHSHVNMNVFWSGTDQQTIKEMGANGLCVATVFNKRNEMRSAINAKATNPMLGDMVLEYDEVPTIIYDPVPADIIAECDAEYKEKVTERAYTYTGYTHGTRWTPPQETKGETKETGKESGTTTGTTTKSVVDSKGRVRKDYFHYDSERWEIPTVSLLRTRIALWVDTVPGIVAADADELLMAVICKMSPYVFDETFMFFEKKDVEKLDAMVTKFKADNTDFNLENYVAYCLTDGVYNV